jgi:hypothetical protein
MDKLRLACVGIRTVVRCGPHLTTVRFLYKTRMADRNNIFLGKVLKFLFTSPVQQCGDPSVQVQGVPLAITLTVNKKVEVMT